MAQFIKKHWHKAAKFIGVVVFTLFMFVGLNITSNPNPKGDINLMGLKLSLYAPSAAAEGNGGANCGDICTSQPDHPCIYIYTVGMCYGFEI
jgi:hypothetical protein